jgi:NDP-mannose synthase
LLVQAVILAGGKGTRLAPYTMVFPKPLMPIVDKPILEIIVRQLAKAGIRDIIMTVGHLAELIHAFFGNGEKYGVHITYAMESKPLGTIGPIANIESLLEDNFLVINGDVLTNLNYFDIIEYHRQNHAIMTIGLHTREHQINLGYVEHDENNLISNYIEKPIKTYEIAMGINVFSKDVMRYIKKDQRFDIPELVLCLIQNREKVIGFPNQAYWLDIGRREDYELALNEYEKKGDVFFNIA